MTTTATYSVEGMTCDHCVRAVTTEFTMIPGVLRVDVDLGSGAVTVVSSEPLGESDVRDAVEEAGYHLVGQAP